ncbi:MAG: hypothetical protein ACK5UW_07365 [bacterium]
MACPPHHHRRHHRLVVDRPGDARLGLGQDLDLGHGPVLRPVLDLGLDHHLGVGGRRAGRWVGRRLRLGGW